MSVTDESPTRFLVDGMCGGVLSYLRMSGYDAVFAPDLELESDEAIAATAGEEGRTIVTRDRDLAAMAEDAILLRAHEPADQLAGLADAGVDLALSAVPERCGRCNGLLRAVSSDEPTADYAPDPAEEPVWRCEDCGQCFWKGSHWEHVAATLDAI